MIRTVGLHRDPVYVMMDVFINVCLFRRGACLRLGVTIDSVMRECRACVANGSLFTTYCSAFEQGPQGSGQK